MLNLEKELKMLIKLFSATKTDYAVLGGLAVVFYGEPRMTFDIDVNIALAGGPISTFLKAAKKFGFYPIPGNIRAFVRKTGVLPMRFGKSIASGRCDIIIAQSPIEYVALKRAKLRKIGALKAKFVTAEDLVIHKITSDRPRDIEDLKGILARQRGKLDKKYILFWLKKIAEANRKPELVRLFKEMVKE